MTHNEQYFLETCNETLILSKRYSIHVCQIPTMHAVSFICLGLIIVLFTNLVPFPTLSPPFFINGLFRDCLEETFTPFIISLHSTWLKPVTLCHVTLLAREPSVRTKPNFNFPANNLSVVRWTNRTYSTAAFLALNRLTRLEIYFKIFESFKTEDTNCSE